MELSNLNDVLEHSKSLNEETRQYLEGLFVLARHWNPVDGEQLIKIMMGDAMNKGSSVQEAAIDCYHFLKRELF